MFIFNEYKSAMIFVWWSGKSEDLSQIEYFKTNLVSKSSFLQEWDATY